MKKEEATLETMTLHEFLQALEDALYEATSAWEPIGFMPCTLTLQLLGESDVSQSIWDMFHDGMAISVFPDDDTPHFS